MATKSTTTALILATFALMTAGVSQTVFAQDAGPDMERNVDQETGNVQVADATSEQNEGNRQGNLISLAEDLLNTNTVGGGGSGGEAGAGPGVTSDSRQGQTVDDPSQGNGALFGDDLGISTALNAAQVNVDLRDLVDLTPSPPPAK
ncbi:MAG TPA: hypothetical protein VN239_09320 [Nitrososphaera sp.]|jgi:hypothetical protein|nr:hypothetical protein [Nitrososphaera sp.]